MESTLDSVITLVSESDTAEAELERCGLMRYARLCLRGAISRVIVAPSGSCIKYEHTLFIAISTSHNRVYKRLVTTSSVKHLRLMHFAVLLVITYRRTFSALINCKYEEL